MMNTHNLWIARLTNDPEQTKLAKEFISLPRGIALNPHCSFEQPIPALPPRNYTETPLLYVHATKPERVYTKLFDIFRRLLITESADDDIPVGRLQNTFEHWIRQYTNVVEVDSSDCRSVIDLDVIRDYEYTDSLRYENVSLDRNTWIYHAAQQEVAADAR